MSFDAETYKLLIAADPASAAAYLVANNPAAAAPASVPQVNFTPPTASQPQAQPSNGYSNPAAVQPAPVLARGTLEDFYNQPTSGGGGPSVTSKFFNKRIQGSWLQLEVVSDVTNADVRQQTDPSGKPQTFKDGRPKFVLVVKVKVSGSSDGTHVTEFPDGLGSIWVKGVLADELKRAMAADGDATGYPRAGAQIVMVSAGEQAARTVGFAATKLYQLQYAGPARDLQAVAQAANPMDPTVASATAATPAPAPAPTAVTEVPVATTPPAPPAVNGKKTQEELLAELSGR